MLPFNRTAYGIEIFYPRIDSGEVFTFNRTAYGIEITEDRPP